MNKKGICSTCLNVNTCIFAKETQVVWQCEEFASDNHAHSGINSKVKVARRIPENALVEESE